MSTAAVFLYIEKALAPPWYHGLLDEVSKLQFLASLIKHITSFLPQRKFRVSVEGEMSTPRTMRCHKVPFCPLPDTVCTLTLHKALIRSVMTYACPAWEFAAVCHLLKLQRLQNRVLRTIGNFPRRTSVRDMHKVFQIPYVYDYITKSCRQQAEVIQNHENANVRYIGQGETRHRKYKRLKIDGGHVYDCSSV
jgi:hypothetical protein